MQTESKFWTFSLHHYSNDSIRKACLALQDDIHTDVNMVLYCCWFATEYGEINSNLMGLAIDFSQLWRTHVVSPLRESRQWMKTHTLKSYQLNQSSEQLRQQIKTQEFQAEKIQESFLETITLEYANQCQERTLQDNPVQASINNIKHYLEKAKISNGKELKVSSRKNLTTIINTVFSLNNGNLITDKAFEN